MYEKSSLKRIAFPVGITSEFYVTKVQTKVSSLGCLFNSKFAETLHLRLRLWVKVFK